jgi:hypothetical protein
MTEKYLKLMLKKKVRTKTKDSKAAVGWCPRKDIFPRTRNVPEMNM